MYNGNAISREEYIFAGDYATQRYAAQKQNSTDRITHAGVLAEVSRLPRWCAQLMRADRRSFDSGQGAEYWRFLTSRLSLESCKSRGGRMSVRCLAQCIL